MQMAAVAAASSARGRSAPASTAAIASEGSGHNRIVRCAANPAAVVNAIWSQATAIAMAANRKARRAARPHTKGSSRLASAA